MANPQGKRRVFAQNFFQCRTLVQTLVAESGLGAQDTVYEIGPGAGIITQELARVAHQVIAVEKDPVLARQLCKKFAHVPHVTIVEQDFLLHHVCAQNYQIFANIPYNITAALMRKLLFAANPPQAAHLVMQQEAAQKFAGIPQETQFSILVKPWFDLHIGRTFARTDFVPVPNVDSVLLQIRQRAAPLVTDAHAAGYRAFVRYGFGQWKMNLRTSYRHIFTQRQWQRLARTLDFPANATPTQLAVAQWVGLFTCFRELVPAHKRAIIEERYGKGTPA